MIAFTGTLRIGTERGGRMLTVGVEEDFLLLGRDGSVVPSAPYVARLARAEDQIVPGFLAYQLRTATAPCGGLAELRGELLELRGRAGDAARRAGAGLVSVGAPPFAAGPLRAVTDETRHRELAGWFPGAVVAGRACACRVHVTVADRDLAVDVLARIRPWLPALLALAVNSPFADGRDTGWASYRFRLQQDWPTFRTPGAWHGAERYDGMVRELVGDGVASDEAAVCSVARVPAGQPVVEVGVADACLTAEDAVFFAGVVRALVLSLVADAHRNLAALPMPADVVDQQLLAAARGEMPVGPGPAGPPGAAGAAGAVSRLLHRIRPALAATGDADDVDAGLARLRRHGTGAHRQRLARRRHRSAAGFVEFLASATVPERAARRVIHAG